METNLHPDGNVTCKNCDNQFQGNFCNNCGQSAHTHVINWHYMVHDIQHGIFHVDRGILYTIKELLIRPGQTIRHFLAGKRIDYFKPIALVFILSGIYGFLYHYFDIHLIPHFSPDEQAPEVLQAKTIESWIASHYSIYILMTIPFYTLGSYLAFRKSSYNFMEHLVINLYMAALNLVVQLALFPLVYAAQTTDLAGTIVVISGIASIAILFYVFWNVFNMFSKTARILRSLWCYILVILFFMVIGMIGGIILAVTGIIS